MRTQPLRTLMIAALLSSPALAHNGVKHDAEEADRPADAPLPFHDHTPLHGGVVRMSGDDHVELVVDADGRLRVYFTDAWRRPLVKDVVAKATITAGDVVETVDLQGPGKDGALSARPKTKDALKRTIKVEGSARGTPVVAYWELQPVVEAKPGVPLDILVTDAGFVPADLKVKAGVPLKLRVTRKTDATCAKDIVVPGYVEKTALPLEKPVELSLTPKKSGTIRYGCSMKQMIGGTILVP